MPRGFVTWCNAPAERLVSRAWRAAWTRASAGSAEPPAAARAVEDLGSRIAGLVRDALAGEPHPRAAASGKPRRRWPDACRAHASARPAAGKCLGAVALVDDMTDQIHADAQQEQLERTRFWRELAAAVISHEIRNPLVAIKTFTQLLPQRYTDENLPAGIPRDGHARGGRLDGIVAQIEGFAHPAAGVIDRADLSACCRKPPMARGRRPRRWTRRSRSPPTRICRPGTATRRRSRRRCSICSSTASRRRRPRRSARRSRSGWSASKAGSEMVGFKLAIVDNGPGIAAGKCTHRFLAVLQHEGAGSRTGPADRATGRSSITEGGSNSIPARTGLCVNIALPLGAAAAVATPAFADGSGSRWRTADRRPRRGRRSARCRMKPA